jgi:hypothetical protein
MDVKGVSGRAVGLSGASDLRAREGEDAEKKDPSVLSTISNDWRMKIRAIDFDIKQLQENISLGQIQVETLSSLQTGLLDFPDADVHAGTASGKAVEYVNAVIEKTEFNGKKILSDFRLEPGTPLYTYMAQIEVEKNRLQGEIKDSGQELKARLVSRENIFQNGSGVTAQEISDEVIRDIKKYLSNADGTSRIDNSHIKDLLG